MPKKKPILYPVVFMVVITAFFTFLLAFINASTIDVIQHQEDLNIQHSILYVFNIPFDATDDTAVNTLYNDNIVITENNETLIFSYYTDNTLKGYAFKFSGSGLWGTITGHIAFTSDFDKLLGVNFIAHSETPGLGGRIDELIFKEQFRNLVPNSPNIAIVFPPEDGANVDAITGATLTSNSVKTMLNSFIPEIIEYAKEVGIYERN